MALLRLPYIGVSQSGHDLWRYVAPGMSAHVFSSTFAEFQLDGIFLYFNIPV